MYKRGIKMRKACTGTVLSRKSYVKANRSKMVHETSIIGAKVYNVKMSGKKKLWERMKTGVKAVS